MVTKTKGAATCTKDSLLENWLKVAIFQGENYGPHARP